MKHTLFFHFLRFKDVTDLENKDKAHQASRKLGLVSEEEVLVDGDDLEVVQDRDPDLAGDQDANPDADDDEEELGPVSVDLTGNS